MRALTVALSLAYAVSALATPPNIPDVRKSVVESPIKDALQPPAIPAPPTLKKLDPEKVAPGKVTWHPDIATANSAAEKSGKPVLLFQLLGDLDQRFS